MAIMCWQVALCEHFSERTDWGQSRVPQSEWTVILKNFVPIGCRVNVRFVTAWTGVKCAHFKMARSFNIFLDFHSRVCGASVICDKKKLLHEIIGSRRFVTSVVCNCRNGSYSDAESYFRSTEGSVYLLAKVAFRRHQTAFCPICWYNLYYSVELTVKEHDKPFPINTTTRTGQHKMIFWIQTRSQYQATSPWKFMNNYEIISLDTSKHSETNLQFNTVYKPYILTELT